MAPPQGFDLAMGGVRPPLADPFVWSAEKGGEGGVRFSGFVPDEAMRAPPRPKPRSPSPPTLRPRPTARRTASRTSAIAGLAVLAKLPAGTVRYDGETWHHRGDAETTLEAAAGPHRVP